MKNFEIHRTKLYELFHQIREQDAITVSDLSKWLERVTENQFTITEIKGA